MIEVKKIKRPISITIVSILLLLLTLILGCVFWLSNGIIDRALNAENAIHAKNLLKIVSAFYSLYFVCIIGFWFMKRWAVYLYLLLFIAEVFLVMLLSGALSAGFFPGPGLLIKFIIIFIVFRKIPSKSKRALLEKKKIEAASNPE